MLMRWTLLLFSCKIVSDSLWPPWTAACQASLSFIFSQSLLKLMSIVSVTLSKHLILLPSVFPSIRVFSIELALRIRWPKDWTISLSISPSNEYSGLISFRIDWFDLLAVQGTPQESSSIPQFKSIHSPALSLLYGTTLTSINEYWKNHSFYCTNFCQLSDVFAF